MSEAPASGRFASQKQKANESSQFEEAFKPKSSRVNFGTLKNEKVKSGKNKKGKSSPKIIILLLALVVLLGGAGAVLYFTGFLTPVLQMVGLVEPSAKTGLTLEEREALLADKETSLNDKEEALKKREEQLAAKEAEQANQANQGNQNGLTNSSQTFQDMLQGFSDEKLKDLKRVSSIYSKMDPTKASAIMVSIYNLTEIATIVYYMPPATSALLMEKMGAGMAAQVTEIMLN